jgi:hypothetical protein
MPSGWLSRFCCDDDLALLRFANTHEGGTARGGSGTGRASIPEIPRTPDQGVVLSLPSKK